MMQTIYSETVRSREPFVEHFREKYGDDHQFLPVWAAMEVISFGTLLTLFKAVSDDLKKDVAQHYGVSDVVLESWLMTLNVIRNICAHHGRLWNRELGLKPKIPHPNKHPEWHDPFPIGNNRLFAVLTILKYLMDQIAPQSRWKRRLETLLSEYPNVPITEMGFKENWNEHAIWRA